MMHDNSQLSCFHQCQLKYFNQYVRHRANAQVRLATEVGTSTHAFSDSLLGCQDVSGTLQRELDRLADLGNDEDGYAIPDLQETVLLAQQQFMGCASALTDQLSAARDPNGVIVIYDYSAREQRKLPRWTVKYSSPERSFVVPLNQSGDRLFMGKIDCIVADENNHLWILELKTSSRCATYNKSLDRWRPDKIWHSKWALDGQPTGYHWALQQFTGMPLAGVLIIPVAIDRQYVTVMPYLEIRHTQQELDNWYAATLRSFDMLAECELTSSYLPTGRYAGNCSNYTFGVCDYYDYCRSGQLEAILMQSTIHKEWSPLATPGVD